MGKWNGRGLILIAMLGLLAFTACSRQQEPQEEKEVAVEVLEVASKDIESIITLRAQLKPQEEIMVFAKTPGLIVTALPIKVGAEVKSGALLFELDKEPIRKQVEQAKNNYELAKENYEKQRLQFNEVQVQQPQVQQPQVQQFQELSVFKSLTKSMNPLNSMTGLELGGINGETAISAAKGQLEQARMAYANSLEQLKEFEYYAPISGIISQINIQKDQMVMNQLPAVVISNINNLKATLMVSTPLLKDLKEGQEVIVKDQGIQDRGKISLINPINDPRTNLHQVELTVNNSNTQFVAGAFVHVDILMEKKDQVLVIPKEAILSENEEDYVYIEQDQKVYKRKVSLGIDGGREVEILEGINLGDRVVVRGQQYIEEGMAVTVGGVKNADH